MAPPIDDEEAAYLSETLRQHQTKLDWQHRVETLLLYHAARRLRRCGPEGARLAREQKVTIDEDTVQLLFTPDRAAFAGDPEWLRLIRVVVEERTLDLYKALWALAKMAGEQEWFLAEADMDRNSDEAEDDESYDYEEEDEEGDEEEGDGEGEEAEREETRSEKKQRKKMEKQKAREQRQGTKKGKGKGKGKRRGKGRKKR